MKKIIIVFLLLSIAVATVPQSGFAKADVGDFYMRVTTETTPFYADKNRSQLLFYLPYTYYVKILSKDDVMARVEVYGGETAAIDGYVPTETLFSDGLEVKNPFVNLEITTAKTTVLYADSALTDVLQYVFPSRGLRYYGSLPAADGSNLFFVSYNGKLGYVKESDVIPFVIENHPNELTFIIKEPEVPATEPEETPSDSSNSSNSPNDSEQKSSDNLKIIIIACLIFAGVIALLVAVKSKPARKKQNDYYDENYFE